MTTDPQNCMILVSGGARSGKSTFAEALASAIAARRSDSGQVAYIATGQAMDPEFAQRIKAHQKRRSQRFVTCEAPLELERAISRALASVDIALVECMPTWLGNLYFYLTPEKIPKRLEAMATYFFQHWSMGAATIADSTKAMVRHIVAGQTPEPADLSHSITAATKILIVVTNETGLGIVPAEALSRRYRDDLGWLNQHLAAAATAVFFCVAGIARQIK